MEIMKALVYVFSSFLCAWGVGECNYTFEDADINTV